MKLMLGVFIVIAYYFFRETQYALFNPTPETYDDLMKLPSFTGDDEFQRQLEDKRELEREKERAKRERESRVG